MTCWAVGACVKMQLSALQPAGAHKKSAASIAPLCNKAASMAIIQYFMHCFIPPYLFSGRKDITSISHFAISA